MKHTPGPWRMDERGEIVGGKYGSPVCELPPASCMAGSITESDANARLIAAAPDLLSALEYALEAEWDGVHDPVWAENARAALKKARGE